MFLLPFFIQGRASANVGSTHYLNKVKQSKEEYRMIMDNFAFSTQTE
ncbi:integrase [uncultured Methanolobus sp.]